jgi:DNA-binding transcriptional ArsR family regulator
MTVWSAVPDDQGPLSEVDSRTGSVLCRTPRVFNQPVDNAAPGRLQSPYTTSRLNTEVAVLEDDQLSGIFAALADPTRRDIVARLTIGDATVGQLAQRYEVSFQAVSKHLKVLEGAGLVSRSRDAQRRPVHLNAGVFDLMQRWIDRYREQAEERYRRLDDVLAEMTKNGDRHDDVPDADRGGPRSTHHPHHP